MEKRQELYKGKAKTVYATDDPHRLIMHYRDDVSAFDGAKLAKLEQKGETNNKINAYVMGKLAAAGVADAFRSRAERARVAGQGAQDDPGRMRGAQHLRGLDGEALRDRRRHASSRTDLRVLLQERRAARPALQRRSHSRARLGDRRGHRGDAQAHAQGQWRAEAAVRRRRDGSRRLQARVRASRPRIARRRSCWATSSHPTAVACGTRRPAKRWTRTASAATLAR